MLLTDNVATSADIDLSQHKLQSLLHFVCLNPVAWPVNDGGAGCDKTTSL